MYLDTSSMVNLTCLISWTLSSPRKVTWYHNHTELSIRGPRSGVSIMVDKSEVTKTVSLMFQTSSIDDSGLYKCQPVNAHGPAQSFRGNLEQKLYHWKMYNCL